MSRPIPDEVYERFRRKFNGMGIRDCAIAAAAIDDATTELKAEVARLVLDNCNLATQLAAIGKGGETPTAEQRDKAEIRRLKNAARDVIAHLESVVIWIAKNALDETQGGSEAEPTKPLKDELKRLNDVLHLAECAACPPDVPLDEWLEMLARNFDVTQARRTK